VRCKASAHLKGRPLLAVSCHKNLHIIIAFGPSEKNQESSFSFVTLDKSESESESESGKGAARQLQRMALVCIWSTVDLAQPRYMLASHMSTDFVRFSEHGGQVCVCVYIYIYIYIYVCVCVRF
jgi:hypothetical protein